MFENGFSKQIKESPLSLFAIIFIILNIIDITSTYLLLQYPIPTEANFVAGYLLSLPHGWLLLMAFKTSGMFIIAYLVNLYTQQFPKIVFATKTYLIMFYSLITMNNIYWVMKWSTL